MAKLGPGLFRIGEIKVDTTKHEASVPGRVNAVQILEFVANTQNGMKVYESALTIDTNAVTFNAAMLMIGLDKEHARVPTQHFDPVPPAGDRVALWIDWTHGGKPVRTPVGQLLFDSQSHQTANEGEWVYTGSTFVAEGQTPGTARYLADIDGVLIGFVHSPAPIIENVAGDRCTSLWQHRVESESRTRARYAGDADGKGARLRVQAALARRVRPTVVLNVVGLTRALLGRDTPHLNALAADGACAPMRAITPAVTCSAQATFLTGTLPREHGIVGNGWYFRDLAQVMFWRQSNQLVHGEKVWETARRRDPRARAPRCSGGSTCTAPPTGR